MWNPTTNDMCLMLALVFLDPAICDRIVCCAGASLARRIGRSVMSVCEMVASTLRRL
jgi:hypothetical protein